MLVLHWVELTECWTLTKDVHGFGGESRDLRTVEECRAACVGDTACVAIDWEPSYVGKTCWLLTSTTVRPTTETGVITHYELKPDCLGQS